MYPKIKTEASAKITPRRRTRLAAFQAGNKKPLRRKSERSGFLLRRKSSTLKSTRNGALERSGVSI
jgi:hypothetical protein